MNDEIEQVDNIIKRLLSMGIELIRRLRRYNAHDSQLPKDIASWICDATDQLLPLMPEDCTDYVKLNDLKSYYKDNQNILLLSANDELMMILKNISIARDCTRDAMRANPINIPKQNLAEIGYIGLKSSLDEITNSQLIQNLKGKEEGRSSKTAMTNIYIRIYLWMNSMVKLNKPEDCLAIAGCVRSILELYVDLNLLNSNAILNDVEKFFSFLDVERQRVAENILKSRK
jgi:hypothetical protein